MCALVTRVLIVMVVAATLAVPPNPEVATTDFGWRPPNGTPLYSFRNSLTPRCQNAVGWFRQNNVNQRT